MAAKRWKQKLSLSLHKGRLPRQKKTKMTFLGVEATRQGRRALMANAVARSVERLPIFKVFATAHYSFNGPLSKNHRKGPWTGLRAVISDNFSLPLIVNLFVPTN
jgi:hypothetical protein